MILDLKPTSVILHKCFVCSPCGFYIKKQSLLSMKCYNHTHGLYAYAIERVIEEECIEKPYANYDNISFQGGLCLLNDGHFLL